MCVFVRAMKGAVCDCLNRRKGLLVFVRAMKGIWSEC